MSCGIRKVGDLARLDEEFLEAALRRVGPRAGGQGAAARMPAAGSTAAIGSHEDPKSISHEHTFYVDTADLDELDSTLASLTEKVARRLREQSFHARTVHLKLRYKDFTTLTRAHTLTHPTQIDHELLAAARAMFHKAWKKGSPIRLIGVGVSGFEETEGQLGLLDNEKTQRTRAALLAADRIRDKFGESSVKLASGLQSEHAERVHENPVGLPGKKKR